MKSKTRNPNSDRKGTEKERYPGREVATAPVPHPPSFSRHPFSWWPPLIIVGAGLLVYANSLEGAFVFDDVRAITNNRYITDPLPAWKQIFSMARPVVTWSLAANYALSGQDPWSYHVFNILVHIAAGLTLFGLVRRTLALIGSQPLVSWQDPLALVVAVLFVVHPLQTESVDYIIQRAESLMGLFYLLTLYALARAVTSTGSQVLWYGISVLACALGMASKEVMVTAPLVALLYDRTFLAGSFARALATRWKYYVAMAATWIVLVVPFQVAFGILPDLAGGSGAGFYVPISRWQYLISESGVLLHYLSLVFWPRPLCLDYQWPLAPNFGSVWLPCIVVVALLAVTAWCLWRHPVVGFLAASFFIILAPTSSIMPIVDLAFEHRMYLALAPMLVLVVFGFHRLATAWTVDANVAYTITIGAALFAACGLAAMTIKRNRDYESDVAIWRSALKARPENLRARFNLAEALIARNRFAEAEEELRRILERDPRHVYAHTDLGLLLDARGQTDEAITHFHSALDIDEHHYKARSGLGNALRHQGRLDEAIAELRTTARQQPGYFPASLHLAEALRDKHEDKEALEWYEKAGRAHADPSALSEQLNALNQTAWALATSPDDKRRDGPRAVTIAEGLCRITEQRQGQFLDTLAAAYAEVGRFDDAQATAMRAATLVSSFPSNAGSSAVSARVDQYRKHLPFRDSSLGSDTPSKPAPR